MTVCNATLTTQTETDEVLAKANRVDGTFYFNGVLLPRGDSVKRVGDKLMRVETHTLTCIRYIGHGVDHFDADGVCWCDDTPGAKPHTPTSTVTDAEVEAARRAYEVASGQRVNRPQWFRAALEAARAAQEDDR